MTRLLFAVPLMSAMLSSPLALAQGSPHTLPAPNQAAPTQGAPAPSVPTQAAPAVAPTQMPSDNAGTGCVDLSTPAPAGAVTAPSGGTTAIAPSESETQPVVGADAGTAPGGAGSSGWTGGLGGSDIGTSQSKELDSSPEQDHPKVASGLDPISGETKVTGPQAPATIDPDAAAKPAAATARSNC